MYQNYNRKGTREMEKICEPEMIRLPEQETKISELMLMRFLNHYLLKRDVIDQRIFSEMETKVSLKLQNEAGRIRSKI